MNRRKGLPVEARGEIVEGERDPEGERKELLRIISEKGRVGRVLARFLG